MYAADERGRTTAELRFGDAADGSDRTGDRAGDERSPDLEDRGRLESRGILTSAGLYDELLRRLALRGHAWE
jgi:hypothetical protein